MAAVADAVLPSPAPLPPPPAAERLSAACLVWRRLAAAVADAVACMFLATMWLLFGGLAASDVGRRLLVCGDDCPVVPAAFKVAVVAGVALLLVLPFAMVLLAVHVAEADIGAAEADIEAAKGPAPKSFFEVMQKVMCDPAMLGVAALSVFTLLQLVGILLQASSTVEGSRRESVGSVISDVGALGMSAVNCFVIGPIVTVKIWRAWRTARAAL